MALTSKQQEILCSLVPGLEQETISNTLAVMRGGDRLTIFDVGNRNGELASLWANLTEGDFRAFMRDGYVEKGEGDMYLLHEQAIIDACKNNFALPGASNSAQIVIHNPIFDRSNVAIGSTNFNQSINTIPNLPENQKVELTELYKKFNEALATVEGQDEEKETAQVISEELLSELHKEKPNRSLLTIKAKGLQEAAKTVAVVTPAVLTAATAIINFIVALHH